jgi:nucleotide-binding universal stress UspA family protein
MSKEDERRILVVADETVVGAELPREIVEKARGLDAEVRVVFPALNTRLRHYASDVDPARKEAESRLERSLEELGKEGIAARGEVGDSDPVQALQDALATGGADEVIIATRSPSRVNWLEKDIVERARKVSDLPTTYVQGKSRSRES